jgi:hypothetical protein
MQFKSVRPCSVALPTGAFAPRSNFFKTAGAVCTVLLFLAGSVHHSFAQTVIFTSSGATYNNTDDVTTDTYNAPVGNCSSVIFTLSYSFTVPWEGAGNLETSEECVGLTCPGDPSDPQGGSCANCWDFLYVRYQIDGVTVFSELIGDAGTTNAEQSGVITSPPICTNGGTNATIIVQTQTWAANEGVTFNNISITCWDASATLSATPNPLCQSQTLNLGATLANPPSVASTEWTGPGTITTPTALNTMVTGLPLGTNTFTFTATDDNSCTKSSTIDVTVNEGPMMTTPADVERCAGQNVNVVFAGAPGGSTYAWTNDNTAIGLGASGTGNLNFTAANVGMQEVANITVTPQSGTCAGIPVTFTITINPGPTLSDPPNQSVCGNTPFELIFNSTPGATLNWTNSNPAIGLASSGSGDLNFNTANVTNPQTGTIVVTPSLNGCTGPAQSFNITVNPAASVNQPLDVEVCAGAPVVATFSGSPGATFSWTNDNTAIGLGASGNGNINFTTAGVANQQIAMVTVTAQNVFNCPSNPVSFSIVVNPAPVLDPLNNLSVCGGAPIAVNFGSSVPGSTFTWTNSNPAIGLGATGNGDLNFTAANVSAVQTGTISVTPNFGGCPGVAGTFTITVAPAPSVNPINNVVVCAGAPVGVTFSGTAGATFSWTNSNPAIGLGASGSGNINFTSANVGSIQTATITVTPQNGTCPGIPRTFTITVNPTPALSDPADQTVCGGAAVSVNFSGTAGATFNWTNSNTAIGLGASGSGNINFTSAAPGTTETATITVTPSIGACPGIAQTFTITISPAPTMSAPANQTLCGGATTTVNFSGTAGATFNWTNSNPAIGLPVSGAGNLNFTTANVTATETATITVTPQIGSCAGTAQTFSITVNPSSSVNPPANVAVCGGEPVVVNFTGNNSPTFSWTNSNPAIGLPASGTGNISYTSPVVAGNETATITVSPSGGTCTGPAQTFTITVANTPVVNPIATQNACSGQAFTLNFAGTPGATFTWTNSNPTIGLPASGSGNLNFTAAIVPATETATISVTPSIGTCIGVPLSFTLNVQPVPSVVQPGNLTACPGNSVGITFNGNPAIGTTFSWTNSNTAIGLAAAGMGNIILNAAAVATPQTGTITVTPALNGCLGTPQNFSITINPTPTLIAPGNLTTCAGTAVSLSFSGTVNPTFNWSNDNTAIGLAASGTGDINFTAANTATPLTAGISVTPIENNCIGQTQSFSIQVQPAPTVNTPANVTACAGAAVSIPLSGSAGAGFSWTNDNPGIGLAASGNGNISFNAANVSSVQTANISITPAAGTCVGAAQSFSITIEPAPQITPTADQSACQGQPVVVSLSATSGAGISWINNNTNTGLAASGNGNIGFTAAGGGTTEVSTVIVNASLNACPAIPDTFLITVATAPAVANPGAQSTCAGQQFSLNFSGSAGTTYTWTNSNPAIGLPASGTGNLNFPTANVPVATTATITVTPQFGSGCTGAAETFTLTVNPAPTINPQGDLNGCSGNQLNINFNSNPGTGVTFDWTNSNPAIGLAAAGTGNISFSAAGVSAAQTGLITVTPLLGLCPGADETFSITINPAPTLTDPADQTVCAGAAVAVNFSGSAGANFIWTNSNTGIGLAQTNGTGNISFNAANVTSATTANFVATPFAGTCFGSPQNFSITVTPVPTVSLQSDLTVCSGTPVNLAFAGSAGATFNWMNDNTAIGLGASGSAALNFTAITNNTPQTANIMVTPAQGACVGTTEKFAITVNPLPILSPVNDQTVCPGAPVAVNFNANNNALVTWTNNNPAIGLAASGSGNISFPAAATPGTANIVATPSALGCDGAPQSFNIVINAGPTANNPGNQTYCAGQVVNLPLSGSSGASLSWTNSNPAIGLAASGSGTLNFTAANTNLVQTANITITPQQGNCTGAAQTFSITITPLPNPQISGPSQTCAGDPVTLNATGGNVYLWTGNVSGASLTVAPLVTSTYTVTVSSAAGCSATSSRTLVVNQPFNAVVDAITCDPAEVGTQVFSFQTVNGCDSIITITTGLEPSLCALIVDLTLNSPTCNGATDGTATISVENGMPPYTYSWTSGGSGNSGSIPGINTPTTINGIPAGNFSITITDAGGQQDTIITRQLNEPAPVLVQANAVLNNGFALKCANSTDGQAGASASGGNGGFSFSWSNGQSGAQQSNLMPGTYTVTVSDQKNCSATATVTLVAPPPLSLSLSFDRPDCGDPLLDILATPGGGVGGFSLLVDGNLTPGLMPALGEGTHVLTLVDANGCRKDSTIEISLPLIPQIFLPADTSILLGQSLTIEATTNLSVWNSVSWTPALDSNCLNCLSQTGDPLRTGRYTVTIVDTLGCPAQATILIRVERTPQIYVPNVFAPDLAGDNQFFTIGVGPGVESLEIVRIYDRWGELVYELPQAIDPRSWIGWDGRFQGRNKNVGLGVYVYYMKVKMSDGELIELSGDVTVVK